jgi:hypothetical protein
LSLLLPLLTSFLLLESSFLLGLGFLSEALLLRFLLLFLSFASKAILLLLLL